MSAYAKPQPIPAEAPGGSVSTPVYALPSQSPRERPTVLSPVLIKRVLPPTETPDVSANKPPGVHEARL